jgi:hypothetical protein
MSAEEFIQRGYFEALSKNGLPVYDVLPTKEKLPAVMFSRVTTFEQTCCYAIVEIVLNILSPSTSKADLYSLVYNSQAILESVGFENEYYKLGFNKLKSSEVQTYRPDSGLNSDGEIWQMAIIKYNNVVSKCGKKIT